LLIEALQRYLLAPLGKSGRCSGQHQQSSQGNGDGEDQKRQLIFSGKIEHKPGDDGAKGLPGNLYRQGQPPDAAQVLPAVVIGPGKPEQQMQAAPPPHTQGREGTPPY
jgi:hypothetical protein